MAKHGEHAFVLHQQQGLKHPDNRFSRADGSAYLGCRWGANYSLHDSLGLGWPQWSVTRYAPGHGVALSSAEKCSVLGT